jgi:hypothetical protein
MRKRLTKFEWAEIRTAYASGIGLHEIARNMGIPAGTVIARAKREGWTQQFAAARLIERPELAREIAKSDAIAAITPMQSAAVCMRDRAERHVDRMAGVTEKVLPHLEAMPPGFHSSSRRSGRKTGSHRAAKLRLGFQSRAPL